MNRTVLFVAAFAVAGLFTAQSQTAPSVSAQLKQAYNRIKGNFVKAAEKMPEENYSFKPAPEVENFGQRVAHIADAQTGACSGLNGERKAGTAKTKTAKADLVAALNESFAACDKAVDMLTDANALEAVSAGRGQATRIGALYGLVVHANEVYGAMGVYMRMKGIVPPSSEGR